MEVFGKAIKEYLKMQKTLKGITRKPLKAQYHFSDNTIDHHLKDITKLTVKELIGLISMYLKSHRPGLPRLKALIDLLALFLYQSEEMQELFPDGDALFDEHPGKMLEDIIIKHRISEL